MTSDASVSVPWGWRDVGLALLLVVFGTVALVIALQVSIQLAGLEVGSGLASPIVYLASVGIYALLVLGVYLFAARRAGWQALGMRAAPIQTFLATPPLVFIGLMGIAAVNTTIAWFQGGTFENPQIEALSGEQAFTLPVLLLVLLLVAGLAPLAEELFFRGMIYPLLRQRYGPVAAILLNAAIFAAFHFIPLIFPALFVLGLLLAFLREWSGSTLPCILYHALQNGFVVILLNAALAGNL
jgi:membrane protease YdiL (CAAX protease family)